ncbi:helix-turn-helix domain-containing protein [Myroides marinus]|uniref:Transposase n=1 Tax=Myroides marinus TaxID=703342 RepID=A0A161S243_9FLAO|nr:helix-turn-helix domain-containing protein [Myroides marinus]KUF44954.1 transposase [Myroides marinus]KZE72665.1 transposase [Myroides marinus]
MSTTYIKRTQKDYTLNFKLQLVQEIERGELSLSEAKLKYGIQGDSTIRKWLQKYGNFDWENKTHRPMGKTPEQKLLEQEAQIRLLEKQIKQLQAEKHFAEQKAVIFDMMINIAEKECKIDIRKNIETAQSKSIQNKKKNL